MSEGEHIDDADWSDFLESLDFGSLVPADYARYRPAVVDGLTFFLDHLSADRAMDLLAEQALMPDGAGIEERLVAIARRCPALHKLGQVLARDRRLSPGFRALLQHLESMPSTLDVAEARRMVEAEIGACDAAGIVIDEPPLAEASVAIVVPFVFAGDGLAGVRGACKVLKPDIEARLQEDLDLLQRIGALLDERCQAYGLPQIEYEETFLQVRDLLAREVHLDREQAHLREAHAAYEGAKAVLIPEVYDVSTPRLTVMERVWGHKVTDACDLSPAVLRKLGHRIIEALVARPLWSSAERSMFHADPHAGNLFVTPERRLAILDWSLVGRLSKSDRVCLTQILVGALTIDGPRIHQAIDVLADGRTDSAALDRVVGEHVRRLGDGAWPGMSWLTSLMDAAATGARCRFKADLVMFRKSLQTLEGVVADVSSESRPDWVLMRAMIGQLAAESGQRALALPFSRHFATHLSTLDLTQLMMSAPLIGSRQWLGLQSDLLRSARQRLAG